MLSNIDSERGVLAGICKYHGNGYLEISDLLTEESFTSQSNVVIFKCLHKIFNDDPNSKVDIALINAVANTLNYGSFFKEAKEARYLNAIFNYYVEFTNVRTLAIKVFKLKLARDLDSRLETARNSILEVTGDETVSEILNLAEDTSALGDSLDLYLQYLEENEGKPMGISTGYSWYDKAIGGGLRKGTNNVIGARSKAGKTILGGNMTMHITHKLKIPVLYADTEMTEHDHHHRCLSMLSGVPIENIENGTFAKEELARKKVKLAAKIIKDSPFYYVSIAGKSPEEQFSIIRRWLVKNVGLYDDGTAKDSVVFYDYLKLMDTEGLSKNLQEYQLLGFLSTNIHNFAMRYMVPFVSFVQLNRDGVGKEGVETIAGSDRIIWLSTSFSIFKKKDDTEIAKDGPKFGNRKLKVLIARHGPAMDDRDYISMKFIGNCARIVQTATHFEIAQGLAKTTDKDDFEIKDGDSNNLQY
jgi:replicative DNA helicase